VSASFLDLTPSAPPAPVMVAPCTEAVITPVRGTANASGVQLAQGDIAAIRGETPILLKGDGAVLVARARLTSCDAAPARTLVKADSAHELSFMHGTMRARLDLDDRDVAPSFYFGRLSGTAAVAEHAHAGTWELLCAVEASGTFTLAGAPSHLGARTCITIPPDTKHSWQPDTGSTLTALQTYWPPGPEQRFKKLAADDLAGARDH
jgi:mannose-6-phosphate isomerase-like protein (cupin superfamily)